MLNRPETANYVWHEAHTTATEEVLLLFLTIKDVKKRPVTQRTLELQENIFLST